jgi:DNA-binding GntR family transcriptional regulator
MKLEREGRSTSEDDGLQQRREFLTKDETVYRTLREWISNGKLGPGSPLDQARLAKSLGTSRMPLRTALSRLVADGLVVAAPHRTPIVAPLSEEEVEDVFAARAALESMVGRVGAERCTEQHLRTMADLLKAQIEAVEAGETQEFVRLDRAFHRTLYEASAYVRSTAVIESLRDSSDRYTHLYAVQQERARASIDDHREILAACQNHDGYTVSVILTRHTRTSLSAINFAPQRYQPRSSHPDAPDAHGHMRQIQE